MNYNLFKHALSALSAVTSVTGKIYHSIQVHGEYITFIRGNKSAREEISVHELYELYGNEKSVNTSVAKKYISGRVQSPAVAILNALHPGARKHRHIKDDLELKPENVTKNQKVRTDKILPKDEAKFFSSLSEILGERYLISKSINRPVTSSDIFLPRDFRAYNFHSEVEEYYTKVLRLLCSDGNFNSGSLSSFIDGLIVGHPILGTRIVEFDEAQHFTPARRDTLICLSTLLTNSYIPEFLSICEDLEYLNNRVLKKHRLKKGLEELPQSFTEFLIWLEASTKGNSGYIKSKKGFDYKGGRIGQRAYYDSLRDTAHLSDENEVLNPPIRIAKKTLEDILECKLAIATESNLKIAVLQILSKGYGFNL